MWPEEIALSCRLLERFTIRTCLNIGSEGKNYRHNRQPWNKNLDDFLEQRNVRVHTLDIDPQASPTYVADISEANAGLNIATYDLVIATHLLEHIHLDRFENAVDNIAARSHNLLIVSVPHKYPYHARPIDNLWRPTAHEIMHKFRHNFDAIYAQTFETEHTDPKFAHTSKCSVSYCLLQRITN